MATKAELVKELRAATQAGMSDCVKALSETNNDMDAAIKWLRERGIAKAAKKAGAIAAEGVVIANANKDEAIIFELNCQTDFTAQNEQFLKLAMDIDLALMASHHSESITSGSKAAEEIKVGKTTLDKCGEELTGVIGEKIAFRRAKTFHLTGGLKAGFYTHSNKRVASLIVYKGDAKDPDAAKNIAMHASAMEPKFLASVDVDPTWLAQERVVAEQLAKKEFQEQGKPLDYLQKSIDGKMVKLVKEICLVDQKYVKDPSITVGKYAMNNGIELVKMVRFAVGEGIEKQETDFAAEVAAQMAQNK